jgi:predicted RNA-binding protein YlxR (DUF448 family)
MATTLRRPKHIPIRSCVVCRQTSEKRSLLRVVRLPEKAGGGVVADTTGKLSGRGAYVCANVQCIGLAAKQKRFERALAVNSGIVEESLFERLLALIPPRRDASTDSLEDGRMDIDESA